jgi:very-short-patch-repair endonuclease
MGLTPRSVQRRLEAGRLHAVHRGVYAVGHRLLAREGWWLAAVLAGGEGAVLSHATAAALWGIRGTAATKVDVTVARDRRQRARIRFHRTALQPDEVTTEERIPVTTPVRTLLDLAKRLDQNRLARAVDRTELLRLTSPHSLDASLARHPTAPGARKLKAIVESGRIGATVTRSELENRFLAFLDESLLPRPQTNARIEGFEVDCVWPKQRVIVELDGAAFHSTTTAFERDRERDRVLTAAGWRVVRVTWRQLRADAPAVRRDLSGLLLDGR